ncbi:cell cycle serine/threonine-protein kinase hsk1 [Quercus suber]|uniref:non-specific serine/threonine protein kinase n=1 Tax=Quercus suber TaxID=58331 RepID=A0AAW0JK06_QUESU
MFRALLSLHKQGIVHRDVKPGNFLFSRKAHKGYLIDFNLAMDLHQKYGNTCKSRMGYDLSINRVMVQNAKSTPPTKGGKFPAAKTLQAVNQETTKVSKSTLEPKNLKKKGHVLFKSLHQGPKVDIWSAGVTLLYLMIGRMPFFGDPEQNIKEISKFRGSEDLWEVAKLHDRESSFPVELYDTQSLPSTKLRDWCETNTKRPEFLEVIPRSLFDLVDKCLTVNPRLRINAEEALKHEFFAPCHEALRKERLCRQGFSLDSRTSHS